MLVDPPSRSHNLGIPGRAAADTCAACLGDTQWGNSLLRHMVLNNCGGCTMQISMHIQVACSSHYVSTVYFSPGVRQAPHDVV